MRATASDVAVCHYRLSRVEYDRAVEAGAFEPDARLELIDGDLSAMAPEGVSHAIGTDLVADCLRRVFGRGFYVRIRHPLAADDYSEPEPDVAVVRGAIRDYDKGHPTSAVLVVEVSNESLRYDRTVKQHLYARCGIPEYWILALPEAPPRGLPRPGERRLPARHQPCSRGQGRAARSPRCTDRRRRSASLTRRAAHPERVRTDAYSPRASWNTAGRQAPVCPIRVVTVDMPVRRDMAEVYRHPGHIGQWCERFIPLRAGSCPVGALPGTSARLWSAVLIALLLSLLQLGRSQPVAATAPRCSPALNVRTAARHRSRRPQRCPRQRRPTLTAGARVHHPTAAPQRATR